MVRLLVKAATEVEEQQFLYDCYGGSSVADVSDSVLEIYNLQARIGALCVHVRQCLLTDDFREIFPAAALALERILSEAETYSSKEQVLHQKILSSHILREHIQIIEKEIKIVQSKGLLGSNTAQITFNPKLQKDVQLIWAGKELSRGKKLRDYIGDNEKTKITIKLNFVFVDSEKLPVSTSIPAVLKDV